jgi:hypothetical protein
MQKIRWSLIPLLLCLLVLASLAFISDAQTVTPAPPTIALTLTLHWDDGTAIPARVTLQKYGFTQYLFAGNTDATGLIIAKLALARAAYVVNVQTISKSPTTGAITYTPLYQFALQLWMIDPDTLQTGQADLVFMKSTNQLQSAKISTAFAF